LSLSRDEINARSGDALAIDGGGVTLERSSIYDPDLVGIYAYGGSLRIENSRITASTALLASNGAEVSATQNEFRSTNNNITFSILSQSRSTVSISQNLFYGFKADNWACLDNTGASLSGRGNRDEHGNSLSSVRYCPVS
jgi:hypothetical protein